MASLSTDLTKALGIAAPVIQGAMQHISNAKLTAAVSEAGGLGTLAALTYSPDELQTVMADVVKSTSSPYAVNLSVLPSMVPPAGDLEKYYTIMSAAPVVEVSGPWENTQAEAALKALHSHGARKILYKSCSVVDLLAAEKTGVVTALILDVVASQEGGWSVLPKAKQQLKVPFAVAGGIATGEQLKAALALGAGGVVLGTRFLLSSESQANMLLKVALVGARDQSQVETLKWTRNTGLRNCGANLLKDIESKFGGSLSVFNLSAIAAAVKSIVDAESASASSFSPCELVHGVASCKEILGDMVTAANGSFLVEHGYPSGSSAGYTLKVKHDRQVHRIVLQGKEPKLEGVMEAVQSVYQGVFVAKYMDDEQELCTLSTATFSDFLLTARLVNGRNILQLELVSQTNE